MFNKQEPDNPYRYVSTGKVELDGGITIARKGSQLPNPALTQQEVAASFQTLSRSIYKEDRSPLFSRLMEADWGTLEHISCGIASGLTCVRAVGIDQNWPRVGQEFNATLGARLLAIICKAHGQDVDPGYKESGNWSKGFLSFTNTEQPVEQWNIYHHALAYGLEQIGKGKINTSGIANFNSLDLAGLIGNGVKVIISVDNQIVRSSQMNNGSNKLNEGTHLISLLDSAEEDKWILMADPYIESFSPDANESIPRWISTREFERFLPVVNLRRGIAIAANVIDLPKKMGEFGYELVVPKNA